MAHQLSQAELDNLIGVIQTGQAEVPTGRPAGPAVVRSYDFRRPDRFSQDQVRTISMLHGVFARLVGMALSVHLRFSVEVTVRSVEQLPYEDFIKSLAQPTVMVVLEMPPLSGKAMLQIEGPLAILIVDRLLGGTGRLTQGVRPLSEVDRVLIERVVEKMLPGLAEAWRSIVELTPNRVGMETNPQFAQIAAPGDIVLLVALDVQTPQDTSTVHVCLPYLLLQPVLNRLSATTLFRTAVHSSNEEALCMALEDITVEMHVQMGRVQVSLGDLLGLMPNDVLKLDRSTDAPVDILVGREPIFRGRPGQIRRKLAVEILTRRGVRTHA
ncbi:MAG: flagellar motor switch protein FliM [Armatimonadetes bacterium]|nr:flagellar motor switch protein FliM [Armatimonadota bacterium]